MARRDSAGQSTVSPDSYVPDLDRKFEASRSVRRAFEPQWFLNAAFLVGNQWVAYDGNQLFEPELEDWRARLVDNRMLPSQRREIARLTKTNPVWIGAPRDQSDRELAAARLRERVHEHYWRALKAKRKLRTALRWRGTAGAGFWKVCWDDQKGKGLEALFNADGELQKDQDGRPITPADVQQLPDPIRSSYMQGLTSKVVRMGDPSIEVRSPFHIFPDPLADEDGLDSCEWIGEEVVMSQDRAQLRFDKELAPDAVAIAGIAESRLAKAVGGKASEQYKGVRLREWWALPGSTFPRGKHMIYTVAGDELLEENLLYPWLPYVMFSGIPVAGRFWPTSTAEQERSPQTERNKRLSQLSENADRIGNPPLRRPASSLESEDDWQGLPGEEIVFDDTAMHVPEFMQVPELPSYIMNLIGLTDESMREVSAQHEVSAGQVPAGVTAAAAIQLLLEADSDIMGPDFDDMTDALEGAGQRLLWMLSRYASDDRMAQIAGDEGMWDFYAWKGQDLGDCSGDSVQVGAGVPQSKAAKSAAIQDILTMFAQSGVLAKMDERDLRQMMQEFEVGGLEKFFGRLGRDIRQVQRENQLLSAGEQLPINGFDDDQAHVTGHEDYQKTSAWTMLDPAIQATFQAHVDLHKQRRLAAATAMSGGAEGGVPDAVAPPAAPGAQGSAPGGPPPLLASQP
jgi:hypothetical protein